MRGNGTGHYVGDRFAGRDLYQQAFQYLHLGYASAMAWLLFVLILLATLFVFRSSARWVYYGSEQ